MEQGLIKGGLQGHPAEGAEDAGLAMGLSLLTCIPGAACGDPCAEFRLF